MDLLITHEMLDQLDETEKAIFAFAVKNPNYFTIDGMANRLNVNRYFIKKSLLKIYCICNIPKPRTRKKLADYWNYSVIMEKRKNR